MTKQEVASGLAPHVRCILDPTRATPTPTAEGQSQGQVQTGKKGGRMHACMRACAEGCICTPVGLRSVFNPRVPT